MAMARQEAADDGRALPVNTPKFWGDERARLVECIDSGWISSEGPFVKEFETAFARQCDRKYGVAVANGTAALDIVMQVLQVGPGDEVILPTLTIISCIQQVVKSGATPVLVDCEAGGYNFDLAAVRDRITAKTKAVLAVHVYEYPVDMVRLLALVQEKERELRGGNKIYVVEDSAELIGGQFQGRPCGSFGDFSTVSFYPNKHITTGEGGMVLCDELELCEAARKVRNLCFDPDKPRFVHADLGFNYRMTSLQAALGLAQLPHLAQAIERKREIGRLYNKFFQNEMKEVLPYVRIPSETDQFGSENIFWVYMIEITHPTLTAAALMALLGKAKVGTRPCFFPLHRQPVFIGDDPKSRYHQPHFVGARFPHAERLAEKSFYLPSGLALTDEDVRIACLRFRDVLLQAVAET
ncbi:unnamed protein product [Amoebophrya sp. A120]|nr:unnamed protein product [Amoebophrya sp. A120]|eukprot:GSA120T00006557001.1